MSKDSRETPPARRIRKLNRLLDAVPANEDPFIGRIE